MSEHAPSTTVKGDSLLERHHHLLRRLHSLSGIVPVGIFTIMHLFTNAQLATGDFQHEVNFIHSMPALIFLEIAIWGGIGFHAALGLVYTFTGKSNVKNYSHADNIRYTLQRVTGIIALLFIFMHVATLRWQWSFGGLFDTFYVASKDGHPLAAATTARALQSNWMLAAYIIGVSSVVYHFSNGLWTAAITWGLTVSVQAQRRWGYACAGLAAVLTLFMAGAIYGARTYEITPQDQAAMEHADEHGGGHFGEVNEH